VVLKFLYCEPTHCDNVKVTANAVDKLQYCEV
jgi:hypothetical protein